MANTEPAVTMTKKDEESRHRPKAAPVLLTRVIWKTPGNTAKPSPSFRRLKSQILTKRSARKTRGMIVRRAKRLNDKHFENSSFGRMQGATTRHSVNYVEEEQ